MTKDERIQAIENIIEVWNGKFHIEHQKSIDEVKELATAIEEAINIDKKLVEAVVNYNIPKKGFLGISLKEDKNLVVSAISTNKEVINIITLRKGKQ